MNPLSICAVITKVVAGVWVAGAGITSWLMQRTHANVLKALDEVSDVVNFSE